MLRQAHYVVSSVCLLTILIAPSSAQDRSPWVGKVVVTKEPGVRLTVTDESDRVVDLGPLDRVFYVVLKEEGPWIKVRQYGVEGWFQKENAVSIDEAWDYFTRRIQANSGDDRAWSIRGAVTRWNGQLDNALPDLARAVRLNPENPAWHNNRGVALHKKQDEDGAIAEYNEAIRIDPSDSIAYYNRGNAYRSKNDFSQAQADYQEAIRLNPRDSNPYNGLAWLLATCPTDSLRDGKKAVEFARKACELENWQRALDWGTMGAAYAEAGQFDEAQKWQKKALDDAAYARTYQEEGKSRLNLYEQHRAFRENGRPTLAASSR